MGALVMQNSPETPFAFACSFEETACFLCSPPFAPTSRAKLPAEGSMNTGPAGLTKMLHP